MIWKSNGYSTVYRWMNCLFAAIKHFSKYKLLAYFGETINCSHLVTPDKEIFGQAEKFTCLSGGPAHLFS